MESLLSPKMSSKIQSIVTLKKQPKIKCLLLTLFPKGIIKKLAINSEKPKKIPLMNILDKPNL